MILISCKVSSASDVNYSGCFKMEFIFTHSLHPILKCKVSSHGYIVTGKEYR